MKPTETLPRGPFGTIYADPPWRFENRTGRAAPESDRVFRYTTMPLGEIAVLPIASVAAPDSHLYLWVPCSMVTDGLYVMLRWGFVYKTMLVWEKTRKDGGVDCGGMGHFFRTATELLLFGVRGCMRTRPPGRSQPNLVRSRKREHSRKPDEFYALIEACSPGPRLELFARHLRPGWMQWGNELTKEQKADIARARIAAAVQTGLFE